MQKNFFSEKITSVDVLSLDVLDPKRTCDLEPVLWECIQSLIPDPLLLEDREDMRVEEPLTARGLIPMLI